MSSNECELPVQAAGRIADLYFYEELCGYIGQDSSYKWLIEQNCNKGRKKAHALNLGFCAQNACPERVRSAPNTPMGRDVPNARTLFFKQNLKTSCNTNTESYLAIQSVGDSKSGLSLPGRGIKLESLKFLRDMRGNLGYGLKRSESFERDVCLLFTDAAHKVLDK